jgi:putative tryptophan/tyrosine transport system substrate-binding protein
LSGDRAAAAIPKPAIGYLTTGSPALLPDRVRAFHRGLSETGFVEGQNLAIEYRGIDG